MSGFVSVYVPVNGGFIVMNETKAASDSGKTASASGGSNVVITQSTQILGHTVGSSSSLRSVRWDAATAVVVAAGKCAGKSVNRRRSAA